MEKRKEEKKKAKTNHRNLVFFPTIYLAPLKVYIYTKFEDSGCNRSRELCDKKF